LFILFYFSTISSQLSSRLHLGVNNSALADLKDGTIFFSIMANWLALPVLRLNQSAETAICTFPLVNLNIQLAIRCPPLTNASPRACAYDKAYDFKGMVVATFEPEQIISANEPAPSTGHRQQ
jgi:hypothetical protein